MSGTMLLRAVPAGQLRVVARRLLPPLPPLLLLLLLGLASTSGAVAARVGDIHWTAEGALLGEVATMAKAFKVSLKSDDREVQPSVAAAPIFPGLAVSFSTGPNTWKNITYSRAEFRTSGGPADGPWTLENSDIHAVISHRKGGRFDLSFTPKTHAVPRVSFPFLTGVPSMDDDPDMFALFPMLGGIFVKNGADGYASMEQDAVMSYPGSFHSPYVMLATADAAVIAAATTWPPHHVHPKRRMKANITGAQPLQIDWVDGYEAGTQTKISILLSEFKTDKRTETAGWQAAILAYRSWLVTKLPPLVPAPATNKAAYSEGTYAMGLMNMAIFNLTAIDLHFSEWKDVLGRVTFWGEMSNYCGPAKFCHPSRLPGEVVGCCELNQSMHPRYLGKFSPNGSVILQSDCGTDPTTPPTWRPGSQCLPAWAKQVAAQGYEIGYYVRNNEQWGNFADNSTWLKAWLHKASLLGGNAQYVDVFARSYNGRPSEVLKLIAQGLPPNDVITEGWNDLYPFAGLISGFHQAYDWCSCCSPLINATYFGQCCNTTIYDMNPFAASNVERKRGSFINMVRLVMGDRVGFFGTEDSEYKRWGWKNNHFSERLAFITGSKLDAELPNEFLRLIKTVRDSVRWWHRGFVYMDTIGITNHHEGLIDVRRFVDRDGKSVLAVDNYRNVTGLSVSFRGTEYAIAGDVISVVETSPDEDEIPVAAKRDGNEGRTATVSRVAKLPVLNWPGARSDWLDVSSGDCGGHKAIGNGKADDTAAIQACLDLINFESANATRSYVTVYFPPGTYRITKTLNIIKVLGGAIIGHGEVTVILWDGESGGRMIEDSGVTRTRFIGLVFDGQGVAGVGFEHDARRPGLYETRIRHQVNKFTNFLTAGVRVGYNKTGPGKLESSEMLFENCIFDQCGRDTPACAPRQKSTAAPAANGSPGTIGCGGVVLLHFNDYDNTFDGCLFSDCQFGIYTAEMANFYAHNTRFERSKSHDMYLAMASGNGIRRCVSQGSGKFVGSWSGPFTSGVSIQDCRVDGWTSSGSAVDYELRGPLLLLDNQFTNAPDKSPPVTVIPYANSVAGVSFSNNLVNGILADQASLLNVTSSVRVTPLPGPGRNHAKATPITSTTKFLRNTWSVPQKVFDVVTFGGASGNGTGFDDDAIRKTVAAAKAAGNGALAYFPPGTYKVNSTIHITGGGYAVGGSGCKSIIQWAALSADRKTSLLPTDGAVVVVSETHGVVVEQISMHTNYDTDKDGTNVTKLLHLGGSGKASTTAMVPSLDESFPPFAKGVTALYDGIYGATSDVWNASETKVANLSAAEKVQFVHIDGNLHLDNAAAGTVLVGFLIQGTIRVSGSARHPVTSKELPIGVLTMVGLVADWDVWVEDDQSLVIVDLYNEQLKAGHLYIDSSRVAAAQPNVAKRTPGRVSILGAKMNTVGRLLNATDYYGSLMYATGMWFEEKMPTWIVAQKGATPMNITLLSNAIWGDNASALTLDLDTGAASRVSILGTLLMDYGSAVIPVDQSKFVKDVTTTATQCTLVAHLDDFRTLGAMDLSWNYAAAI